MVSKCLLRCVNNGHEPIVLPHLQEVLIGRSPETLITDPNCSRHQVCIKADCDKKIAYIKQVGVNQSGINGFALTKNDTIAVDNGTFIEILLNDHIHEIKFESEEKEKSRKPNDTSKERSKDEKLNIDQKYQNETVKKNFKRPREDDKEIEIENKVRKNLEVDLIESEIFHSETTNRNKTLNPSAEDCLEKIDDGLLYIFTPKGIISSSKIAAYDIDGTIIKTKSGNVFPKTIDDWQIAFPEVPSKLKKYSSSGYKIVFFTNQAGIGNGKLKIDDFRKKLESILRRIGVSSQVFISSGKGIYRKPAMGMWDTLVQMKNDDLEIDMKNSFYCGDAAGRKKDHSLADRLFANNIGLPFCTPEHHFGGSSEAPYEKPSFDPKLLDRNASIEKLVLDKREVLVLVGLPGSGKSFLSKQLEKESKGRYKALCRDVLGSWQKCTGEAAKFLKAGKSVIADSTNPDKESRGRWISLAKANNVPCRCMMMDVSLAHSQHNNRFRQLTDTSHVYVTDMVFHSYRKKYEEPATTEGFSEIVKVKFIPQFESDQQESLYFKHLLEK